MKGLMLILDTRKKGELRNVAAISAPVQVALEKLKRNKPLTKAEDELLLTPIEVAAILSWKKGTEVSPRYLSQMIRDGRLEPDSLAGGKSYRYKMSKVRAIQFKPAGRPSTKE
jgi:hypothetical protein